MKIQTLSFTHFRNHGKKTFKFEEGINLIHGPNGVGKTNTLEAVYLLATAKSPRSKYDRDLINYDQEFCTIVSNIHTGEDKTLLELQVIKSPRFENASSKKAKINKTPKSLNYFTGTFNAVMFTPENIGLITGTPSERRKYIDMVLVQTDTKYKKSISAYKKAVRQRNKLLEQMLEKKLGEYQIDYWNKQLLELGTYIQEKRDELFEFLKGEVDEYGSLLEGNGVQLDIKYLKNEMSEKRLEKYKDKEILARTTLVGPHRDDFEMLFDGRNLANFGSRGQQRMALLALKLSERNFIKHKKEYYPVLLLDDIFSELDDTHKKLVLEVLKDQQTIITSAEPLDFLPEANTINL
jgi:DNA replication and repair protein RecF